MAASEYKDEDDWSPSANKYSLPTNGDGPEIELDYGTKRAARGAKTDVAINDTYERKGNSLGHSGSRKSGSRSQQSLRGCQTRTSLGSGGPATSLHSRTPLFNSYSDRDTPSPDTYNVASTYGKQTLSRTPSAPAYKFGTNEQRPPINRTDSPGPGSCNPEKLRPNHYSFSLFGHAKERVPSTDVPGPGSYKSPTPYVPVAVFGSAPRSSTTSGSFSQGFSPGPGQYDLGSTFGKGLKFALKSRVGGSSSNLEEGVPGPGHYEVRVKPGHEAPKINFGKGNRSQTILNNGFPGPGAYDSKSHLSEGPAPSLHMRTALHNPESERDSPSPDSYNTNSSYGKQVLGRSRSAPAYKFGTDDQRPPINRTDSPGPGSCNPEKSRPNHYSFSLFGNAKERVPSTDVPGPGSYKPSAPYVPVAVFGSAPRSSSAPTLSQGFSPGPGAYELGSTFGKGLKFALKSRVGSRIGGVSDIARNTPGPGAYDSRSSLEGRKFGFGSSSRASFRPPDYPGPGAYEVFPEVDVYPSGDRVDVQELLQTVLAGSNSSKTVAA
mmetsp:Transcript_41937/g.68016  ORF Transcript_41937/g.68016 Transcript_41937/m.68016 type:complete len:548 (+) Transcript_41937:61-1704(+)